MADIADALAPLGDVVDGLQVTPFLNQNPTPPSVDVYPGDPFQSGTGMGVRSKSYYYTVRARVSTADLVSGQSLLLRLLDPDDAASVEVALTTPTRAVVPDGVSGFREYTEDAATSGRLLGCEWRVQVLQ